MFRGIRGGWHSISAASKRNPAAFNACAGMLLGGGGDVLAQKIEGADSIDLKRTVCVCAWYGPAAVLFWTPFMGMQARQTTACRHDSNHQHRNTFRNSGPLAWTS